MTDREQLNISLAYAYVNSNLKFKFDSVNHFEQSMNYIGNLLVRYCKTNRYVYLYNGLFTDAMHFFHEGIEFHLPIQDNGYGTCYFGTFEKGIFQ